MDHFLASIILFAGNYAPRGWAFCRGQLLSINSNSALFSLLGTTYGGDGQNTFALPNLGSRVPVGTGQGPGLRPYTLGETGGQELVTLTQTEIPHHSHFINISSANGTTELGAGHLLATGNATIARGNTVAANMYTSATPNAMLSPQTVAPTGGSQPHLNMQPYLALNYIICMEGVYPSRN